MATNTQRGPVMHRIWVWLFSILFGLLAYWLIGFVLQDISDLPDPDYEALESEMVPAELRERTSSLDDQLSEVGRQIGQRETEQTLLKNSIANQQRTMGQLLDIQRLSLENEETLTDEAQTAMSQSIEQFLTKQQEYERLCNEIAELTQRRADLQEQRIAATNDLDEAKQPVYEKYDELVESHEYKLAFIKLAVLVPILLVTLALFVRNREGTYAPMIYALGIAVAVKVLQVMHEHFPHELFRYVLIVTSLAIVGWILVRLLQMVAHPKRDWLLRQYRDAYEAFQCPVCSYPIRRGPLKYLSWTRRSIRKLRSAVPASGEVVDAPYTCPMCGTTLFEECAACHATRHSLLPACDKCGAVREVHSAHPVTEQA